MVKISSLDAKSFFEINFLNLDKDEGWINCQIILNENGNNISKASGSFFEFNEIRELIDNFKKLKGKQVNKIESSFLEPNLKIEIEINDENFTLNVLFRELIDYEDGEIGNKYDKRLRIITDNNSLSNFIDNLEIELSKLKSPLENSN